MIKPSRPFFGSGPTVKPLGWHEDIFKHALISRSHRSKDGIYAIYELTQLIREVLEIPLSHQIAVVPGSATGSVQMAMWNLLGVRPVDVLISDVFADRWYQDIKNNLSHISSVEHRVPEGSSFDFSNISWKHDVLFLWNASTGGTKIPNACWIPDARQGLTLCDATSAVYCMDIPWQKLDATAFSWQKGLGGEAGFGVLVLGPRAFEHLESFPAAQPVPFILNLRRQGQPLMEIFQGKTLNTLSMLCLEDAKWCHKWSQEQGGLKALIARSQRNLEVVDDWLKHHKDYTFLVKDVEIRSSATICISFKEESLNQWNVYEKIAEELALNKIAFDCLNHRGSVPSFRIWGGPTMEVEDLKALLPWLDHGLARVRDNML